MQKQSKVDQVPNNNAENINEYTGTLFFYFQAVLTRNDQTNFVVILGCSSCLLQCLVSILVLTAFWWRNRTWLNFLKIQCCAAIIAAMATFIYAVHNEISEVTFFPFFSLSLVLDLICIKLNFNCNVDLLSVKCYNANTEFFAFYKDVFLA